MTGEAPLRDGDRRGLLAEIVRFLGAGAVNTLLTLGVYQGLLWFAHPQVAYLTSWLLGIVLVVVVYPRWVFRVPRVGARSGGLIVLSYLLSYGLSALALQGLTAFTPLSPRLGVFGAIGVSTVSNYLFLRWAVRTASPNDALARLCLAMLVAAVAVFLGWRMTLGVDLSDESYYLSFIDGWLKTGIRDGQALALHQTAALLAYPLARIYAALAGGTDGLALFMRGVYLMASALAGLSFFAFARRVRGRTVSVMAAVFVVSFIPFSLPAPSYNTLGMHGLIAALSTFGVYARTEAMRWAWLSAFAWMVATVAYPTLGAVLAVLLAACLFSRPLRADPAARRYVLACIALQATGALLLLGVYGAERLQAMLAFTNASLQVTDGLLVRLGRSLATVRTHPSFMFLCAASVVLGATWRVSGGRRLVVDGLLVTALVALHAAARITGPVLYASAHDAVLLLGLTAAAFLAAGRLVRRNADHAQGLLDGMTALGLLAGLVTAFTATNGLVNFAVGGFVAGAFFVLAALPAEATGKRVPASQAVLLGLMTALLLRDAAVFVYGEGPNPWIDQPVRIRHGVFAGLATTPDKADAIARTTSFLERQPGDSMTVLGRLPGIYLLTAARPVTMSTWDFGQQNGAPPAMDALIRQFHSASAGRPDLLVVVSDPWTRAPSGAALALLDEYVPTDTLRTTAWTASIHVRGPASSGALPVP